MPEVISIQEALNSLRGYFFAHDSSDWDDGLPPF